MTKVFVRMRYIRKLVLQDLRRKWNRQKIEGKFNSDDFKIMIDFTGRRLNESKTS